ncbi:MAG: hypothetical protein Q8P80_04135, partial [Candidatus Levybacteria bacterium]|nr:hypothetical protein [Candidatus Levybacteria bacterium]
MEKSPSDPVVYVNPDTQNVFRKFLNFVGKDSKRTIAGLAVLVIVAAVPLTVFISQQRQETRQRASGTCTTYCTELFQCGACDVTQGKLCAMEYQSCDGTVNKVPVACQTAVEPSTCSLTPPATTLTPPTLPLSATIALTSEGQANGDPYKFQTSVQGQSLSIAEIYVQNKSFTGNADSWGCKGEVNQKWCLIQRKTYNGQSQDTFQSQWVPPIAGEFQAVVNVQTSSGAKCTGQNPMPVETTWKYCGTGSDVSFTATGTGTGTGPGTGGSTDLSLSKLEVSPITPNSLDPGSVSVAGTGNTIKIFLHDSGAPAKCDGITYDYNPQEVQPHTFYYWGQASAPAGINTIATNVINISHVPNIATTYAVYANVYTQDGNKICAWDGLIYTKAADGKFNSDGTTCPTAKATFSVLQDGTLGGDLSIDSLVVNPETAAPKADVRIFAQGQGGTVKVYFHGTNNPTVNDPLSSPYNPDNVVNNIFYYIGGLSSTIKAPAQPGTYYVAANLVAQSPTYGDTSQTICAWNTKVYKLLNGQTTDTGKTCSNVGVKTLVVNAVGVTIPPTSTPTSTPGTGGPNATNTPTNTPT